MTQLQYDNIFDAICDSPEEASELQIRADLMIAIRDMIKDKGWKQAQTAKVLGINQPRVSNLENGQVGKFSTDTLFKFLFRIGYKLQPRYQNQEFSMSVSQVA